MGIRKKLKTKICEYLLKKGIFTSKKTDPNKILSFLNMVRPKSLDIENIRIGGDNVGGYIVPNDFYGVKYCFSPGVGSTTRFEDEITKKNIKCFLADYSVNPKFKNDMSLDKRACVPITIDNFPLLRSFLIFNLSMFLVILDKLLILISKSLNLSSNVLKCCSTNIVVGATIATCLPEDATTKDALIATSVFPNPTSPQINLSINLFE